MSHDFNLMDTFSSDIRFILMNVLSIRWLLPIENTNTFSKPAYLFVYLFFHECLQYRLWWIIHMKLFVIMLTYLIWVANYCTLHVLQDHSERLHSLPTGIFRPEWASNLLSISFSVVFVNLWHSVGSANIV